MSFEEWNLCKLGDIVKHKKGFAFKSRDLINKGHPVVKVSNFTSDSIDITRCFFISENEVNKYSEVQLKTNDVIIATVGSWPNIPNSIVGKVIKVPSVANGALLNQNSVILRATDLVHQSFIYYRLKCKDFSDHLIGGARGSANQANIALEDIFKFNFKLPNNHLQKKIASILSSLDDKIELNRQTNQTLEVIAQALFKEWFVDFNFPGATGEMQDSELGEIPKGWKVGIVGELFELQRGFDLPINNRVVGSYPVIAASGVNGSHNEYKIKAPGVTTGRSGVLGNVFYIQDDFWPLNTSLFIKDFKVATPLYAFFVLQDLDLKNLNGGSAVPTLNRNEVHKIKVVIPEQYVIQHFETNVVSIFKQIKNNEEEAKTLTQLRDSLLPKLMKGEIPIK